MTVRVSWFASPSSLTLHPDLGGFAPTTPHPPPKKPTRSQKNVKSNGRIASEAGPSSKSTKAPRQPLARKTVAHARNRASPTDDDDSDVQEVVPEDEVEQVDMADAGDEDIQMVDVAVGKKGAAPLASIANGKPTAKGKGKTKVPAARSKKTSPGGYTIDVDAFQERDELDDDVNDVVQRAILVQGRGIKKDSQEVVRLQEKLCRVSCWAFFCETVLICVSR